jgi:catechol 2,3-dioxygenase
MASKSTGREKWRRDGKFIFQKTDPLDIDAIVREIDPATATYSSAPEGLRIGHIHLRVGNVARAEAFYCGALGLDVTHRRTGATFLSRVSPSCSGQRLAQ